MTVTFTSVGSVGRDILSGLLVGTSGLDIWSEHHVGTFDRNMGQKNCRYLFSIIFANGDTTISHVSRAKIMCFRPFKIVVLFCVQKFERLYARALRNCFTWKCENLYAREDAKQNWSPLPFPDGLPFPDAHVKNTSLGLQYKIPVCFYGTEMGKKPVFERPGRVKDSTILNGLIITYHKMTTPLAIIWVLWLLSVSSSGWCRII